MKKQKLYYYFLAVIVLVFLLVQYFRKDDKGITELSGYEKITLSKHAKCRMECRDIDISEIKDIVSHGRINESKTRKSEKGISYAVEGTSDDGQELRIVCSPHNKELVIVTVIDTGTNWPCDCK